MRANAALAAAVALFATCCGIAAAEKPSLELISIEGIRIKPNERVVEFHIDTWAVAPLMVCQIPYAWEITAGKNSDPQGVISGRGDIWASLFTAEDLRHVFVLAQVWNYHAAAHGNQPPTFTGTITTWTAGYKNVAEHKFKLKPSNFVHRPATACPPLDKLAD